MTVEDEGLEPNFEVEEEQQQKKKKKKLITSEAVKQESENVNNMTEKSGKTNKKRKKSSIATESSQAAPDDTETNSVPKQKKKKRTGNEDVATNEKLDAEEQAVEEKVDNKKGISKKKEKASDKMDSHCKELLDKLKDIAMIFEVRKRLAKEVENGNIDAVQSQMVLQKWRRTQKASAIKGRIAKIVQMDGTIDDVKKVVNELLEKRLIRPYDVKDILYKWKTREKRRIKRHEEKQSSKFCYQCRQHGHLLSDCPNPDNEDVTSQAIGICFKCGSGEHSVHKCPRKHVKGFPFATCFVCNQQGHLSKDCEQNSKGIYPDGGSCNVCGSQKHLKRDCPELAAQKKGQQEKRIVARAITAETRPDDDYETVEAPVETTPKKKKARIIKF